LHFIILLLKRFVKNYNNIIYIYNFIFLRVTIAMLTMPYAKETTVIINKVCVSVKILSLLPKDKKAGLYVMSKMSPNTATPSRV